MKQYHDLLSLVLEKGKFKPDRTGTGTYSVFGAQTRYDLGESFPILTTRKIQSQHFIHEVLWFLRGDTNVKYLNESSVKIWNSWADSKGDLGRIYGAQWCDWRTSDGRSINQIDQVIDQIRKTPDSRRLVVSAWNPGETDQMSIPNCCSLFQFYVRDGELSCQLYQRSADLFLGVPMNIGQYSLLTLMLSQVTGLKPGEFIHTFGDLHLYKNHLEQARLQLTRKPKPLPKIKLNSAINNIHDFRFEDFQLVDYDPYPPIKAQVSV